ncbi:TRAP transporter large permease [Paracoccus sulfuroxidans]|uniref:TRAP transporter large permease protein n=1 Tax=Paracoccus sulfuroxidans TaxID=384678 RepID=A0A562NHN0_9RHOB|nr:TRAP transporter large permease [Paracoccus sulfuroxidans]TWI31431.1 tripartite ATP-independent transporter DctM subunit [Paracoccus sulfuroxidans]
MIGWILLAIIVLIILRAPIFVALGAPAASYLWLRGIPLELAPQRMLGTVNESILLAVPMFLLAGALMNRYGATARIFDFAQAVIGHVRGGLGYVTVLASMVFSAMSGSAAADAVGVGKMTVAAMRERGYDPNFAAAVTLSSATMAPVIPPSIIMIIYGATANVSIGKMFLGGIVPGLLMAVSLMITVGWLSARRGYGRGEPFSFGRVLTTFWRASLVMLTPVLVIGGIFSGALTPTEASAIAVVYVIFLGLVYRKLKFSDFYRSLVHTGTAVGALMLVVSVSGLDAWVIAREQIPMMLAQQVTEMVSSPTLVFIAILLVVLVLGLFMDATPIILMLVPAIAPLVTAFGIDPLHLGVLFCIVCVLGLITPPVGVALYGVALVSRLPMERVFAATIPFFIMLLVLVAIMIAVPSIVTWLPNKWG